MTPDTLTASSKLAFPFLHANHRPSKPRTRGLTEIRGPYYSVMGPRYLSDVLDTMGEHVDALKFAGGSFTLMPEPALSKIIEIAHDHNVLVSTGGFIEHVLTQGPDATDRYIDESLAWASTSSRSPPASSASPPTTSCAWSSASRALA
jgi:phosphosulfolactate synthase (CoM biosynthesis protein A)